MKIYKYLALGLAVALGMSSCSLDTEIYDNKDGGTAYNTLKDISNGLNGAYRWTGYYSFLGNYALSFGDFCAGISTGSSSSGHFAAYSDFTFSTTSEEIEDVWNTGYKIITSTTEVINNAESMLASGKIGENEQAEAYNYIGQAYALKALAAYYLVNIYALPYSDANKTQPGIVVIDKDIPAALSSVARGTIDETYTQIKKDITSAEDAFKKAGESATTSAYYMGSKGLQALKSRVFLSLGDYASAETAAKQAIALSKNGDGTAKDENPSIEDYLNEWSLVAENPEDIFTIKKSDDDNLSANALNTLYGSYNCVIQNSVKEKLKDTDIRTKLLIKGSGKDQIFPKFYGKSAAAVTNIPIFRKSEMSLIIAECEARTGSIAEAQNYLMYTAKRDTTITSTADLPSTKEGLLSFISDERIREFFGEGHRFYDARRMGDKVSGDNFQDWDIQKFVFPIPAGEINSGFGVKQNENWSDNLPSKTAK